MAIPKKKRRIISVNQTKYYWRKESNRCLYIETGQSPNFIIKGYFEEGYFAVPQVVRAVIDYAVYNKLDNQSFVIIENGQELFKKELENHHQNENEISDRKIIEGLEKRSQEGWDEYHAAKKCITEKDYFKALHHLISTVRVDPSKKERWFLLENFISDDIKNAELLNERAFYYRKLSEYEEYKFHCIKAAFNDIEQALKLDPNCAIAYGTLAELLYDQNDIQGFYYNWEKALQKRMTQSIDGWIKFCLKDEKEFIRISKKYQK